MVNVLAIMVVLGPAVKIKTAAAPELDRAFSYALTGCGRVQTLARIYDDARAAQGKLRGRVLTDLSDILRGAVMLCHANLEQLLRDLIYFKGKRTSDFFKDIPLPGYKRGEKFTLFDLVKFKDQPASKIIDTAVHASLEQQSFTNTSHVGWALNLCGQNDKDYKRFFPLINELMERRHHIVHTADVDPLPGPGRQITRSLSAKKVRDWNKNITNFILFLHLEILESTYRAEPGKKP